MIQDSFQSLSTNSIEVIDLAVIKRILAAWKKMGVRLNPKRLETHLRELKKWQDHWHKITK